MTLFGHFTYPISIHVSQSLTPKSGSQEVKNRVREKRCEFAACLVDGLCVLSRSLGRGGEGGLTPSFFTASAHGCQMAKFDPFLSLDCARAEGRGAIRGKDGIKFCSVV